MNIDRSTKMSILFDYYGLLLTEKQRRIFTLYHEDNLSLSEIGDELELSKQGVHDALKKAEFMLEDYEEKLHLIEDSQSNQKVLSIIKDLIAAAAAEEGIDTSVKNDINAINNHINRLNL